ncbi:MAG: glycosyltransferase [Gemmatimonadota bacterium]
MILPAIRFPARQTFLEPDSTAAPPPAPTARRIIRYYPRALVGDGGITSSVGHQSRELVRAGAEVVIAYDAGEPPRSDDGVEWVRVRHAGWPWPVPQDLDGIIREADLLVLHSAWAFHNVRAGAIARQHQVPYLLEPRGAYDPAIVHRKRRRKKLWWRAWERDLVQGARAIHVFFDSERAHLEALGYRGDVIVAPNGVEVPPDVHWDGGSGGYVLWMGRFDPEHKGIDLLLQALALLSPTERPPLRLHGPDARSEGKAAMRQLVGALDLDRWVTIGGPIHGAEKFDLLARARGFVYPSRWEAFGNATAEAAALGVPTLVTPHPLGRHLAGRGAAFLAEATPAALAAGLRDLLKPEAAAVGRRAAALVREEITWPRVARSWLEQVEELL